MERLKQAFSKDPCQKYYNMTRTLGQGSFATVKLAICKADQSKWAIKVIKKTSLSPEDEEALQSEVSILQKVNHPNIVQLKEVFDSPNNFYMVMELCTGGELFDRIVTKEHYSEREARDCIRSIVEALKYCHDINIVHRDLKPENLLYSDYDESKAVLKLADFGLAQLLNDNAMMTAACGTPGYVAPEILEGRPYGKEVDMWGLGVISYILLCGFPPFYDESNKELFRAIKAGQYDYPSPFWDDVSPAAKDLIDHLLVLKPEKRYTAGDVLAHSWMNEGLGEKNLGHFKASMKAYNARRKFRATILTVQMMNTMTRASAFKAPGDRASTSHHEGDGGLDDAARAAAAAATAVPDAPQVAPEGAAAALAMSLKAGLGTVEVDRAEVGKAEAVGKEKAPSVVVAKEKAPSIVAKEKAPSIVAKEKTPSVSVAAAAKPAAGAAVAHAAA